MYEHANRVEGLPLMAELFHDAGWSTAAFVDGGQLATDFAFQEGFDRYVVSGAEHRDGGFLGGGLAELGPQAVAWLRGQRDRPFFLFLHTYDIHCPYFPPEPYRKRFVGETDPGFEVQGTCGQKYFNQLGLGAEGFHHVSALYDAGVLYTDRLLGQVLAELESLGLSERTIVVITADHGESLGERDRIGHNEVRDVQLKVPLVLRGPGIRTGVVPGAAQSIDLLPTLLSLAGIPAPEGLPGVDLGPILAGRDALPTERFRLAETANAAHKTARVDARWSLLLSRGDPSALYDLQNDPAELQDRIASEPAVAERIFEEFRRRQIPVETVAELPASLDPETARRLESLGYVGD